MKKFLNNIRDIAVAIRDIAIAGFMALLPVYVLILIVEKAWKALHTAGAGIAGILGVQPILGVKGNTMFTALLVMAFWFVCGLLVRYTFMGAMSRAAEEAISKYIPDYAKYKSIAEEKLEHKVKVLEYTSALIRWQEYWRPAYVVEQDKDGNCVVFLPDTPETNKGNVLLAKKEQIRVVSSITANQLDESLKKMGRGLCSEYGIHGYDFPKVA
jgi:uncharacterized membrane protein